VPERCSCIVWRAASGSPRGSLRRWFVLMVRVVEIDRQQGDCVRSSFRRMRTSAVAEVSDGDPLTSRSPGVPGIHPAVVVSEATRSRRGSAGGGGSAFAEFAKRRSAAPVSRAT